MTPTHRHRAYTLVEVLVVVAVLGIATAIVAPSMLQAGSLGVQAAARATVADVLYAQNEAMTHNAVRRVVFDPGQNRYRLTTADGTLIESTLKGGSDENFEVDFDQDSRFRGVEIVSADFNGSPVLEFDDLGTPVQGGDVVLEYDNQRFRITVAGFTGRVTVAAVEN